MPRTPTRSIPAPPVALTRLRTPQSARARVAIGPFAAEVHIEVTPLGLMAAGALVSAILLSVVPIIRAASTEAPPPA